jgi:hypothetical protein
VSWSPVGDVIATDLTVCAPGTSLYAEPPSGACADGYIGLAHVATGAITVLGKGSQPDFSPNGSEIAYYEATASAGRPAGVDIMSASGRFIRQVVPPAHAIGGAKTLIRLAGCVLGRITGPTKNRSRLHVVNQKPKAHHNVPTGTKVSVQIR